MSVLGPIEPAALLYFVLAFSALGAATDLLYGRIFNWLTLPALCLGLIASGWLGGWQGFSSAGLAVIAGLLLYGWMFVLGAMGGGDVKFLMALGAWGGLRFVVETALLGVMIGGLLSVGLLVYRGTFVDFLKRMQRFLLSVFVKELEAEKPKIDHSVTMPFGVPIALAAVWVALGSPLEQMGVSLWWR